MRLASLLGFHTRENGGFTHYESRKLRQIVSLCRSLLSERGEVSGTRLASETLEAYQALDDAERSEFFDTLAKEFSPDPEQVGRWGGAYRDEPSAENLAQLQRVVEPPRQELFRRLNMAPGGTRLLVEIRRHLLNELDRHPQWAPIEADLGHLLLSWFNRGFLVLQRIDWSTPAILLEKLIAYEAVQIDRLKRHFAGAIESEHYHARYPKEHEVRAALHHGRWIVRLEVLTIRIPKCYKRPLARREPRVESVGVFTQSATAFRARGECVVDIDEAVVACITEFCWYWDAPDDLSRDVPILDVVEPMKHYLLVIFRKNVYPLVFNGLNGRSGKLLHRDEPLRFDLRLYFARALVADGYFVHILLINTIDETFGLKLLNNLRTCIFDIHTGKFSRNWQELAAPINDLFVWE